MASSSEVLREYLIALGFQIDKEGAKKFDKTVQGTEKVLNGLGKAIFSVGAATTAMVAAFAYNMEKLYYASQRTKASVGNIQALQFGAQQIGVSGETMLASLEGMAKSIRNNPGILALIKSFGIQVEGRDMSDVMRDTVKVLASMPHYVGAQFAAMFGMDEQTLLHLKNNMAEFDAAVEKRRQMAKDMGVDADAAAKTSKELLNSWRGVVEQAGLFKDQLAIALLPAAKQLADVTGAVLQDWSRIVREMADDKHGGFGGFLDRFREGVRAWQGGIIPGFGGSSGREGVQLTPQAGLRAALGETRAMPQTSMGERASRLATLAALEKKYGLPAGILGRVWKAESDEGRDMLSPAGAKGHFQFMDSAAQDYGLRDPFDFDQSADAAARYYRNMLQKYGGDARMAAAAYNWGPGNLDRYGIGAAPAETRGYIDRVAPNASVNQKTEIKISGVENPTEAARLVLQGQDRINADIIRNIRGAVQ
jgi:hypothetical protein